MSSKRALKKMLKAQLKEQLELERREQSPIDYEHSQRKLIYWLHLTTFIWTAPLIVALFILSLKILMIVGKLDLITMLGGK